MPNVSEADVLQGLRDREFILYYQPKTSLITGRIVGAEALVRWRRADATVLGPAAFFPAIRDPAVFKRLTLQLFGQLMHDMDRTVGTDIKISFNVNADDLNDDTLSTALLHAVREKRLVASSFELEITETQALQMDDALLARLQRLLDAGIGLAMDDFGVGYSSIETLSKTPFTAIKLDQAVIGRMLGSKKDATIVRSSIRMAHELGMEAVAEGVETDAQRDFLIECGCKLVQGYLISPPITAEAFSALRTASAGTHAIPVGLVQLAIVDHIQWRHQMVSYAIQRATLPRSSPMRRADGFPEMSTTNCAIGCWYRGEGAHFAGLPMFTAIEAPHRELHRIGRDIVEQIRQGATLADLAASLNTMKAVSTMLVRLLEDLEDEGFRGLYEAAMIEKSTET